MDLTIKKVSVNQDFDKKIRGETCVALHVDACLGAWGDRCKSMLIVYDYIHALNAIRKASNVPRFCLEEQLGHTARCRALRELRRRISKVLKVITVIQDIQYLFGVVEREQYERALELFSQKWTHLGQSNVVNWWDPQHKDTGLGKSTWTPLCSGFNASCSMTSVTFLFIQMPTRV